MPAHPNKRMRLSSPTFDDQVADLSQHDIDALDSLDAQLHSQRIHAPFTSASAIDTASDHSDEAGEAPPEVDHAAWFNSDASNPFVGFSSATAVSFQRPSINGQAAKSLFIPSAAALREAQEKMAKWQDDLPDQPPTRDEPDSTQMSPRATFHSARNAFSSVQAPETPTPAPVFRSANAEPTPTRSNTALQSLGNKPQTKAFKSPMISSMLSHRQVPTSSPLLGFSTVPSPVSPLRPSSVANHVATQKPLGFTPRHGSATTRPKFVTPFKTVAKSATPKASVLENIKLPPTPSNPRTIVNRVYPVSSPRPSKRSSDGRIFDISEYKLWISKFLELICLYQLLLPVDKHSPLLACGHRPTVPNNSRIWECLFLCLWPFALS